MKIFKGFNTEGPACPICKTNDDKECTLLPIAGSNSEEDPMLYQAKAIHIACLDLLYYPSDASLQVDLIIQKVEDNT